MADDYFSDRAQARTVLVWVSALRLQLDRWERLIAKQVAASLTGEKRPGHEIWRTQIENRFALIASRQFLRALGTFGLDIEVDESIAAELKAKRDLLEHWDENMPVFNVSPRPRQPPRSSGRDWAARNPDRTPFGFIAWNSKQGSLLTPHVPTSEVRDLADRAAAVVLQEFPEMAEYLSAPEPSPWLEDWWPRQDL